MATSGISTFNATMDTIIRQAALQVNAVGAGQTMGAQMSSDFKFMLNVMVKTWQADGLHVWTTTEATLFPTVGQVKYGAGTGATDHITSTYYETAITTAEAAAQTVLSVDATTNMTAADYIGIVLDDGSTQWTTISSKTSTTVTVAVALTGAAASGNAVFNYTSKIARPLKIVDARRYNIVGATDTPMIVASRQEYNNLPQKTQAGSPIHVFYDAQLTVGYFYLWQVPSTTTDLVKFTWHRPIQDFNTAADNPDVPAEWLLTMVYNLAQIMMPQYPVSAQKANQINQLAAQFLNTMRGFDRESESIFFAPEMGWR